MNDLSYLYGKIIAGQEFNQREGGNTFERLDFKMVVEYRGNFYHCIPDSRL